MKVGVAGLQLLVSVGWDEAERLVRRPVLVDVELQVDYDGSGELTRTVDLEAVVGAAQCAASERFRLLEDLAAAVAQRALGVSPLARTVRVSVHKPLPPLEAHLKAEWAEVVRTRDGEGLPGAGSELTP
ncbi:MAG: dihydroneopterin aldolase [Candidatus Bipolaricaulaceae bacterium]